MEFQNDLNGLLRIVTSLPSMKVRSAIVTLVHCSHVIHMSAEHLYLQDKAAQKAQKATKNVQKAGPGRVGGKR